MEFPVILTKGEFKYPVDSQAALDYHLMQGWSIQTAVDYTGLTADQVEAWGKSIDQRLTALEAAVFPVVSDEAERTDRLRSAVEETLTTPVETAGGIVIPPLTIDMATGSTAPVEPCDGCNSAPVDCPGLTECKTPPPPVEPTDATYTAPAKEPTA